MGNFTNLPREIILEILTRLPAETVLECKLVCKPWIDVVRYPSFAQLHLTRLRSAAAQDSGKLGFIFTSNEPAEDPGVSIFNVLSCKDEFYYSEYDDETPFDTKTRIDFNLPEIEKCSIAGSCNGLICFRSWRRDTCGPVYICNPVTREYIMLPDTQGIYYLNGFGYCPSTNEYKVVRYKEVQGVQVYTLGSGNGWRNLGNQDIKLKSGALLPGEFANGAIHWPDHCERTILAFCLADEKCGELPYPPCLMQKGSRYLGVLGDFLSVTCYGYPSGCEIWLLKKNEDNNDLCWSKEFSFESHIPRPFGIMKRGRLLCYEDYKFFGYILKASSVKVNLGFGKSITEAIPHINTLVSLKVLGEKDVTTMESSEKCKCK